MNKLYYKYWGKAKKLENGTYDYHLLPYHCLDVAAVGEVMLKTIPSFLETVANVFKCSTESFSEWFLFFLSMHDIGKFSVRFQNLCPDILEELQSKKSDDPYYPRHDQLGLEAYNKYIFDLLYNEYFTDIEKTKVETFLETFTFCFLGHHGVPPEYENASNASYFLKDDINSIGEFYNSTKSLFISDNAITELRNILHLPREERKVVLGNIKQITWQLAGFVTICDWIGSGDKFKYSKDEIELSDYYQKTLETALIAVNKSEIIPAQVSEISGFEHLFPALADSPSPLQKLCDEIPISIGPQLWILEDVTGSGKTEAALTLASRILSLNGDGGCFVALPTMATSNAMYERMAAVYTLLFKRGVRPSLVLSHGSRHLSETFSKSYKDNLQNLPDNINLDENGYEEGRAHCAQWLADSSKKALLADCGVGTVDQILLSGLPVRYQSLRAFGIWRKILIIDEVHAYDAYMIRQLENIIQHHGASGGSVILLSATLPHGVRKTFVDAFSKGLGQNNLTLNNNSFPLVTCVDENGQREIHVDTRDEIKRTVRVNFYNNPDDIYNLIKEKAAEGKCVCWIRNTITDVMESFSYLKDDLQVDSQKLDIFHSRLALHDRLRVEKKILNQFGKKSSEHDRSGRIIIASQVIEQSLDLDFDVIISDLAPIDLLIQRAGRLYRHRRDERGNRIGPSTQTDRLNPVLYVYSPPDTEKPTATWYEDVFPSACYVYKDTAVLWRTNEILKQKKELVMPDDARELVEKVYGEIALETPEVFYDAENNSWADIMSRKSLADFNVLDFASGYSKSSNSKNRWDLEERVPSRLGDEQNTVYLCRWINGEIEPMYNEGEFPWDMSSLKLRKSKLMQIEYPVEINEQIEKLKQQRRFRFDTLFVVFYKDAMEVTGISKNGKNVNVSYSSDIGLLVK